MVYHLGLNEDMTEKTRYALLPGDPGRVPLIASLLENPRQLAFNREYCTALGYLSGSGVLVTSTGIGGPSASIAVEELSVLGVDTFIRIGSCGAIQSWVKVSDLVNTAGSVRLDGASSHYAPPGYPALAHHSVVAALAGSAAELGIRAHVGVTASTDTFYAGQERYDSFSGYVLRRFQGSLEEMQKLGVLNYEMESATILTMASVFGHRAGCLTAVVANRSLQETVRKDSYKYSLKRAASAGVLAMKQLIEKDSF